MTDAPDAMGPTSEAVTDAQLRELVRDAIARHGRHDRLAPRPMQPIRLHPSHGLFPVAGGGDACLIEPSVPCSHCGYCQSYGH